MANVLTAVTETAAETTFSVSAKTATAPKLITVSALTETETEAIRLYLSHTNKRQVGATT